MNILICSRLPSQFCSRVSAMERWWCFRQVASTVACLRVPPKKIPDPNGNALWQNGITFAFRSMMVIYPKKGHGVVVLTNSASSLPVAYDIAERALGGKAAWKHF